MSERSSGGNGRVGVVERRGRFTVVEPFFERGRRITVDVRRRTDVRVGDLVLIRFTRSGRAQVVRSLGRPDVPRNVIDALLLDRGYERGFPPAVDQEAATAARSQDHSARRDLTSLPTFTIDPASARDFDDAISAERDGERDGDGVRLYVHIADVGSFVPPGSATDREAADRGNSVYVPGTVEPMLPAALSSDACSLVPGRSRRAVTVEIPIDEQGGVGKASFYRSLIRSDVRLTYEDVDRLFAGDARAPEPVAESLVRARAVAAALKQARLARGALAVETSEPEFEFDERGRVTAAHDVVQTEAHGLIEQLMICANECVAERLQNAHTPTIYRVHEQPDPAAVERLVAQLESLDVPTPPLPAHLTPRRAGEFVGEISRMLMEYLAATGRRGDALVSLVLRSLKQAVYSPHNVGHAGLASSAYCHFTSPIRRYPDLCVHRALLDAAGHEEHPPPAHELEEIATQSTATERAAMTLERDADDICFAFLLERELARSGWDRRFEGEVSGVIGAGAFVSFTGVEGGAACEGFLPARRIGGDWYDLNEEQTALVGRNTGRMLRLADPVEVVVRSVEPARGRVDLEPAASLAAAAT
jgi:ribonuclease R